MIKQKALIGKVIDLKTVHVTDDLLRRVKHALDGWSTVNESGIVSRFFLGSLGEHQKVFDRLNIKAKQQLHSRESLFVCENIKTGDTIEIETVLQDIYEQQISGNPLGFVITDIWGKKANIVMFHAQRITVVRGGFARRSA